MNLKKELDLRTREKILTIMLILKDIGTLIIWTFIFNVIFCICIKNDWFSPFIPYTNINNSQFWIMFKYFLSIIPLILFFRGLSGKYTVMLEKTTIDENNFGKAKCLRFRRIRRIK